jgi:tRNA threonylcarbamoyladenosine biosynthesis protein TsaE
MMNSTPHSASHPEYPSHCLSLPDEAATLALGKQLAAVLGQGGVLYLQGDLGAGKTTLSRGIVQSLGHSGAVKSPTYTLVEPYELPSLTVFHFDLYRLADPEELEFIGIRDYFDNGVVCLIEWPDKGGDMIPQADLILSLEKTGNGRSATLQANTEKGQALCQTMLGQLTKV